MNWGHRQLIQTTLTGEALEVKCQCGNTCNHKRGLEMHQKGPNCGREGSEVQRTAVLTGEMQENSKQDQAPVSPTLQQGLPAKRANAHPPPARERINWPWCQPRRRQRAFVPKEIFSTADQCRTTSLLNVKGKIFFSALAKRMASCMIEDGHISTATWKGRVTVFLGCQKHTGVVRWSVWLKLAKAIQLLSGWIWPTSRDKSLTGADLDHYHIPQHMEGMSVGYYGGIKSS